jgi:hypothetical protein
MKHEPMRRCVMILGLLTSCCVASSTQTSSGSIHCDPAETPSGPCTGQITNAPAVVGIVSVGGAIDLQGPAETVTGHPYTAQAITEIKQTLSNGSHITQKSEASVGRDSKGRTFRIQTMSAVGPWVSATEGPASGESAPTLTTIFDPVSKTHIDYTNNPKVAHVVPLPDFGRPTLSVSTGGGATAMYFAGATTAGVGIRAQTRMDAPQPKEPDVEQLGEKTIEGFKAVGKRTRVTIPANAIGNDSPIEITHETWYSPELKVVVESTQNDPRFGQTTYSLVKISAKEPSEKLFQVPEGYTVEDIPAPPSLK